MNRNQQKNGFSLIEVLVSVSLFIVITTSALNVFKMVIDSQRSAIATQNVEESLKYFLEVSGKEIRMAKRNNGLCAGLAATDIYNSVGGNLSFRNYHDQCVTYSLESGRFKITRGNDSGFVSPAKINIDELRFVLRPETNGASSTQATVTMELVAHALGKDSARSEMRIQTTLTSRYYLKN